ncbi:hypothetical protein GY45DRAFT_1264508 [Cubamyces sp. BRFM 1775]|nr:hypothetical protein GY45DRAFT_1264508 [Cubamyces sp. BRFM 1775]
MVCLNLPEHLRYLPENIYLVGVVPGPTKPSTDQINHFLALVVDELLDFWDPGVLYSQTALRPQGRLVRAALVPVVADLLAARQLSGFGPHNHNRVLCSVCITPADNVEDTNFSTFEPRNLLEHRAAARAWLEARSTFEREQLFETTGVRWSELLRLEYWNPLLYTVVDTMHNLYLGLLQRHIRTLWGINVEADDGDASGLSAGAVPDRPPDDKMAAGLNALLHGTSNQLKKVGKPVLYHLCVDRGLRRAGTVSQLVKNLDSWVNVPLPEYGDALVPEIEQAERALRRPSAPSVLPRKKKPVLITMCTARALNTSGTKEVLARRLLDWYHQERAALAAQQVRNTREGLRVFAAHDPDRTDHDLADAAELPRRGPQEAIGRETMGAYMEDRSRIILPSWLNPPPLAFGTKQHGKLSADQWRTLCVINLPITLIRTWGFQEPRRVKMLDNFLKIVEAVETFGLLEIDEKQIVAAETLMQSYLEGVKELYKGAKIQPNHHLALHIGIFLRLFGPVHSWRAFVFERFNYFLQSLNTNMAFGELEMTFMMHSCRAANFRPLLRLPVVQRSMEAFSKTLHATERQDRRGMRLDAILRSASEGSRSSHGMGEPTKGARPAALDSAAYQALLERLSFVDGAVYIDERSLVRQPDELLLPRAATRCSAVHISGVYYKPWNISLGDSHAMYRHPTTGSHIRPGRIEQIFLHSRRGLNDETISETFLLVKCLKSLNPIDAALDPYRKYPSVGGSLYYDAFEDKPLVLRTEDVTSHFAQTSMEHLVVRAPDVIDATKTRDCRISKPCVHVRPLDRVSLCQHRCTLN